MGKSTISMAIFNSYFDITWHNQRVCSPKNNQNPWKYLLIPFLMGWTSIYQLFWCELQGYKVLTHCHLREILAPSCSATVPLGPAWWRAPLPPRYWCRCASDESVPRTSWGTGEIIQRSSTTGWWKSHRKSWKSWWKKYAGFDDLLEKKSLLVS